MGRMRDEVIIVTGATGGIGGALCQWVVDAGGQVVASDLDDSKVHALVSQLGKNACGCVTDVSQASDNQKLVQFAQDNFGHVDGAFLNAGIEGRVAAFDQQSEEDWQQVLAVNFHGPRLGAQAVIPALVQAGGGSIVMTSSVAGVRGAAGLAPYVSSKHALIGLMRSLAAEYGPKGIRVNTLNPGPVDNRMMRSIEEQSNPGQGDTVKQAFTTRIPLGRYVTNEECAALAGFLLSDESSGISGNTYMVDGGYCAG